MALTVGLAAVHEGVHGILMAAFGAKPEYGVLKVGARMTRGAKITTR